jgi:integrase
MAPSSNNRVLPKRNTARHILNKKPTTVRELFTDPLFAELKFRLEPSGRKSFYFHRRFRGKRLHEKLGEIRGATEQDVTKELAQARAKTREWLLAIEAGTDPRASDRQAGADDKAIETVVAAFIEDYRKTHRSAGQVKAALERHVVTAWAGRQIDEITPDDIRRVLAKVARTAPIQANRLKAHISVLAKWARRQVLITTLPTLEIERPTEREIKRDRALSDPELRDVWAAAGQCGQFGQLVRFLILSGVRRGEAAAASRKEMDFDRHEWLIGRSRTKNAMPHLLPITPALEELIDSLPIVDNSPLIFPATRGDGALSGFNKRKRQLDRIVNQIRAERGEPAIEPWRLHDIRRSVVSTMARLGIALEVRERVLGHHRGGTMSGVAGVYNVYDHASEVRSALECWHAHVAGLVAPQPPAAVVPIGARRRVPA